MAKYHPRPTVDEYAIADILDDFLQVSGVPGVAAGLFTSAGMVAQAGRGVASMEQPGVAMTPRTVGAVYSLTKVMTGTALAVLAARHEVDLDTPVSRYLPDSPGRENFAKTTLRHLLTHTAGLVGGPVPFSSPAISKDPLEQYVLGACLGAKAFGEPGEVFGYSDTGIVIAGYVLQRVTGRPFTPAMRDTLFAPAGMARTTLDPLVAMTFPMGQQHVAAASGELAVRHRFDARPMMLPSSGAFSCAEDLARLGVVHLRGDAADGGPPLLTERITEEIHRPFVDVGLDIIRDFGLAVAIGPRYGEAVSVGHEGHHDGGWVKLQLIPEQRIGVAWLDNRGDDLTIAPMRQRSFDRLMHLLGAGPRSWRRERHDADADMRSATGRYARPTGRAIEVTAAPSALCATDGATAVRYEHCTGRVYTSCADAADLPAHIPWAPDRDSTRSALCVVGPASAPSHILLNGLPYQRLSR